MVWCLIKYRDNFTFAVLTPRNLRFTLLCFSTTYTYWPYPHHHSHIQSMGTIEVIYLINKRSVCCETRRFTTTITKSMGLYSWELLTQYISLKPISMRSRSLCFMYCMTVYSFVCECVCVCVTENTFCRLCPAFSAFVSLDAAPSQHPRRLLHPDWVWNDDPDVSWPRGDDALGLDHTSALNVCTWPVRIGNMGLSLQSITKHRTQASALLAKPDIGHDSEPVPTTSHPRKPSP